MPEVIWKKELKIDTVQKVKLPFGSKILIAREQYNTPCIWFICNPAASVEDREIYICGTGHVFTETDSKKYLGTAMIDGGTLVLHIFEKL